MQLSKKREQAIEVGLRNNNSSYAHIKQQMEVNNKKKILAILFRTRKIDYPTYACLSYLNNLIFDN